MSDMQRGAGRGARTRRGTERKPTTDQRATRAARPLTSRELARRSLPRAEVAPEVAGRDRVEPFDEPGFDPDDLPEGWEDNELDPDGDWDIDDDVAPSFDGRWRLAVTATASGDVEVGLATPASPNASANPALQNWIDYLEAIGTVLAREQSAAILAPRASEAFTKLRQLPQAELQNAILGVLGRGEEKTTPDGSQLSRARRALVACRWGTVPLEFFWWTARSKISLADRIGASQRLLEAVAANPDASDNRLKVLVGSGDWIRKEVPVARDLLDRWPFVLRLRHTPESWSQDTLDRMVPRAPGRGEMLVRLAVVGLIEAPRRGGPS